MGYKAVKLPIEYLELPLWANYKELGMWDPMLSGSEKRLAGWNIALLFKGGDLHSSKAADLLTIYYISLLTIPMSVARRLETSQCKFLWCDLEKRKKYYLVAWDEIKKPISQGGLG